MPPRRFGRSLHAVWLSALALAASPACNEAGAEEVHLRLALVVPSATAPAPVVEPGAHPADDRVNPEALADEKRTQKKPGQNMNWVPKEFAGNMAKWKDTGLYVDGKPVGFFNWGELPIGLKTSWLRDRVSADKDAGTSQPGWKYARKRFYKFTDYFQAVGLDLHKIKEVHVYSAHETQTLIVPGKELLTPAADGFYFWFGSNTSGKAIPHIQGKFGNGRVGDKISSVMVYVNKKPPTLVDGEGMFLDGVRQSGVPYYGEPVRGGIRVYLDDKLATIIKRQDLDPKLAIGKNADGDPEWRLADFFKSHGVDTRHVVEMWVIRAEKRSEKYGKPELDKLIFQAGSQSRGGIYLGDNQVLANAIALHTRHLKPSEMPIPQQDDE
ncbi:MAG TPA: hypothetical protein VFP84_25955 [Kofleriaceae bacterium]|nr:hypothetical protein [Kofleriaceae bacterium]